MKTGLFIICFGSIIILAHSEEYSFQEEPNSTAYIYYNNVDPYHPRYRDYNRGYYRNDPALYHTETRDPYGYYDGYYDDTVRNKAESEYYRNKINYYRELEEETPTYIPVPTPVPVPVQVPTPAYPVQTQVQNQTYPVQTPPVNTPIKPAGNYASTPTSTLQSTTDAQLKKKIIDSLKNSVLVSGIGQMQVDVSGGSVNLSGFVQTTDIKNRIEAYVRNIEGVKIVNNKLEVVRINGSKPEQSSSISGELDKEQRLIDLELHAKINEIIQHGENKNVFFDVKDGEVILTGSVDKSEDLQNLDSIIRKLPGVRSLDNRVKIPEQ